MSKNLFHVMFFIGNDVYMKPTDNIGGIWYRRSGCMVPLVSRCRIFYLAHHNAIAMNE